MYHACIEGVSLPCRSWTKYWLLLCRWLDFPDIVLDNSLVSLGFVRFAWLKDAWDSELGCLGTWDREGGDVSLASRVDEVKGITSKDTCWWRSNGRNGAGWFGVSFVYLHWHTVLVSRLSSKKVICSHFYSPWHAGSRLALADTVLKFYGNPSLY